jgi:hypothetical protein
MLRYYAKRQVGKGSLCCGALGVGIGLVNEWVPMTAGSEMVGVYVIISSVRGVVFYQGLHGVEGVVGSWGGLGKADTGCSSGGLGGMGAEVGLRVLWAVVYCFGGLCGFSEYRFVM